MTPTTGEQRRAALDAVLPMLACPVCLGGLIRETGGLGCERGHRHDVARQGYAALAPGSRVHGDTAAMVAARSAFLARGHLDAVAGAVVATLPHDGVVADLAGGPGFYAARTLDERPALRGIGLDLSPAAARAAAGAHPRLASATADVWRRLPLRDASVQHLLDVFGPRNGPEFARVLAPGGAVTVVTPLPEHLAELRQPFGTLRVAVDKAERVTETLRPLHAGAVREVRDRRVLEPVDAARAVLMGPNGHHLDPAAVEAVAERLGAIAVTIAVRVAVFRRE